MGEPELKYSKNDEYLLESSLKNLIRVRVSSEFAHNCIIRTTAGKYGYSSTEVRWSGYALNKQVPVLRLLLESEYGHKCVNYKGYEHHTNKGSITILARGKLKFKFEVKELIMVGTVTKHFEVYADDEDRALELVNTYSVDPYDTNTDIASVERESIKLIKDEI